MIRFTALHPAAAQLVGYIPLMLEESDPRPAAVQFNERYAHGGGWSPLTGWRRSGSDEETDPCQRYAVQYPGDPVMRPVAIAKLRDEVICVYPHAWVGVFQPGGELELSRMD